MDIVFAIVKAVVTVFIILGILYGAAYMLKHATPSKK